MATVQGDILEATIECSYGDKVAAMVTHYRLAVFNVSGVLTLTDWLEDNVLPLLADVLHTGAHVSRLYVKNLFDAALFQDRSYNAATYPGEVAGDYAPDFVAISMKAPRSRTDMRHGYKRVPFVSESVISGMSLNVGAVPAYVALASALSTVIAQNGNTYQPVTVKRIPYVTSGGKDSYRLPNSQAELVYNEAVYSVQQTVTSQVSRK